jgi:hypothetical protein
MVSGSEFVGVSARAKKAASKPEKRTIEIYDHAVACGAGSAGPPRYVSISVPWTPGYAADFSLGGGGQLGAFVVDKDGTTTFALTTTGRVEVIEAPLEKGGRGRMRLRMSAPEGSVEGEIAVDVCE